MAENNLDFRPGDPFYDMVESFVIALAGSPAIINENNPMNLKEGHYITIEGILTPGRHILPYEVHKQIVKGDMSQDRFLRACCCMLANTAFEAVKDKNDHSPEFEFFRHVRNASSHGNRFHFHPREPARPAAWRAASIDPTLKGSANSLHGVECFGRIIGIADILVLLEDIKGRIAGSG